MKGIDTNILIRFIMKDDEKQAQSVYEIPNSEIVKTFSDLLAMPVLLFESENVIQNFIESTTKTSFDLSDLLIAHSAYSSDCKTIFTFDKKASKFKYFELLK